MNVVSLYNLSLLNILYLFGLHPYNDQLTTENILSRHNLFSSFVFASDSHLIGEHSDLEYQLFSTGLSF